MNEAITVGEPLASALGWSITFAFVAGGIACLALAYSIIRDA